LNRSNNQLSLESHEIDKNESGSQEAKKFDLVEPFSDKLTPIDIAKEYNIL
jgi:hypothetical protein